MFDGDYKKYLKEYPEIWKNLNTVCSFKSISSCKTVSKIASKGVEITAPQEIYTEFNHYFSSI